MFFGKKIQMWSGPAEVIVLQPHIICCNIFPSLAHCEICMENTRNKWKSDRHFLANVTETKFGLLEQCSKIRKKVQFGEVELFASKTLITIF